MTSPSSSPIADAVSELRATATASNPDAAPTPLAIEQLALSEAGIPAGVMTPGVLVPVLQPRLRV